MNSIVGQTSILMVRRPLHSHLQVGLFCLLRFGQLNYLGGNPAFKVYDVNPETFEIMDARVIFSTTTTLWTLEQD